MYRLIKTAGSEHSAAHETAGAASARICATAQMSSAPGSRKSRKQAQALARTDGSRLMNMAVDASAHAAEAAQSARELTVIFSIDALHHKPCRPRARAVLPLKLDVVEPPRGYARYHKMSPFLAVRGLPLIGSTHSPPTYTRKTHTRKTRAPAPSCAGAFSPSSTC